MKITKIKIVNFGQFSNVTFTLPSADLNVFFGENEAGKSTVVAFIKQVLFGFHLAKHTSDFFEDYKPLARVSPMGGSLFWESPTGDTYELERLYASGKGSKLGTLTVKRNGELVPENVFFAQIKNIDGDFYSDSFIFNQDMLAKVGEVQQADLLERIYYLGAANSDQLIDLRDEFAKKAGELFKKGGSNPPINQLLRQIKQERSAVDEAEQEFDDYQKLQADYQRLLQELNNNKQQLQKLQKRQEQRQQLQKLVPNYQKLLILKAKVKPVNFDQSQYDNAQTLLLEQKTLLKKQQKIRQALEQFEQEHAEQSDFEHLIQAKPEVLQWRTDYRNCLQSQKQVSSEKEQLKALNPGLDRIAHLKQAEILQLQEEYQEIPQLEVGTGQSEQNSGKFWLAGAGAILLLGIVMMVMSSALLGGLVVLAGASGLLVAYNKQKQVKKQQDQLRAHNQEVEQRQKEFAAKYGIAPTEIEIHNLVNSWRQYQFQEQKAAAITAQENELLEQTKQLANKLSQALRQEVASDFDSVLAAVDQLDQLARQKRHQKEEQAHLQANLSENDKALKELGLRLKANYAQAQVADFAEYTDLKAQKQEQETMQTQIAVLNDSLKNDLPELKAFLNEQDQDQELDKLSADVKTVQEQTNLLQSNLAEIKVKMTNLANSQTVFTAKQQLANTETKFKNLSADYLADLTASQWIARALDLASNERFPKMLVTAKEYLRLLTNNRYNNIEIDKKLTVTRFDGKKIKVQYLSRGTAEQLYFALKLAFIVQIKDQINLPLLIDDSFVNFDDQRVDQIKQLLMQISQSNQVLIFTAQTKLVEKLELQPLTFTKGTNNV